METIKTRTYPLKGTIDEILDFVRFIHVIGGCVESIRQLDSGEYHVMGQLPIWETFNNRPRITR